MPDSSWFAVHHRGGRDAGAVAAEPGARVTSATRRPSFISEEATPEQSRPSLSCDLLSYPLVCKLTCLIHIITNAPFREEVLVVAPSVYAHQKLLERRVVQCVEGLGVPRRVVHGVHVPVLHVG